MKKINRIKKIKRDILELLEDCNDLAAKVKELYESQNLSLTDEEEDIFDNAKRILETEIAESEEERYCVKCGKTSDLLENEDMCYTCAKERNRI